ncbi:peroxiredoxin [Parabacteroides sp. PF5-5]|uniref:redoxin family protein n=1 Tax=unclassified Parabacteroides TaxID=2649774 RepID=UPI00247679D2|nr:MULTISPECIES: redoxin family protein [unclassified Parabacteroides]MDH6306000.1 peroxiredoxin [Parabacteroides sp. PH5-39]MDH6317256.1 peroxiredoxin [Parabacteroides sp. PF5-13]MDH6320712.1 peroxiredoxin [Parabacteroides sp. PH5-13]MDH6324367.1 peroxiredoxin [Parabacteroides sp. PH5-8]MDH6328441.1 peroxiredoxin [Parabacteroides sp. PH5-41]
MKKILLIISTILILFSCGDGTSLRVEGKLTNLEDQTIYVVFESEDYSVVDTVECEKPGQFKVEQKDQSFNRATLFFENRSSWFTVYLEPGVKVSVTGDVHYPVLLQAKGGKLNNELTSIRKKLSSLLKEQADLIASVNNGNNGSNGNNEAATRLINVNHQLSEQALSYIQDHKSEQASVVLIQTFFADPDDTRKLDELLISLDPALKDFYLVGELEQYSIRAKRTALGAEAPNFMVKNIYGKMVNLESFKSEYLLLTFTAPWCDMCQTDDLYLDEIDQKYSDEKVSQLLISLDDNMEGVRQVLKKDSIQWNLVTDSAGQASMLVDLYNVSALPRCFLIDDERKIILKTENGVEVKQTIEKLFNAERNTQGAERKE